MASIIARKRKDGSTAYRAQIIIKRKGLIVHREAETFDDEYDARLWAKKREAALAKPDGVEQAKTKKDNVTLGKLIERYQKKVKPIKDWGRTKEAALNAIKNGSHANDSVLNIDSSWIIDFCLERKGEGAGKATVNQDYAFLRSIFSVAKDVLRVPLSVQPFDEARPTLVKLDLVGKSEERERRPDYQEMTDIMRLASEGMTNAYGRSRNAAPADKIILFQMFSSRRISETCRLLWSDLDKKNKKILVRDMKDPARKKGNDVLVLLPDEAFRIIESMPKVDARIFPYNPRSIEARFSRLRDKAGYYTGTEDDLRLHDLRHECLSWLAEKSGLKGENWDIPRLQMVSGHKNWNVLQRYVNLLTEKPHDRWAAWEYKP